MTLLSLGPLVVPLVESQTPRPIVGQAQTAAIVRHGKDEVMTTIALSIAWLAVGGIYFLAKTQYQTSEK